MGRRRPQYASHTQRRHVSGSSLNVVLLCSPVHTIALFCSKEGAAQVRLKLGLYGDDNGHNFTFTSPQAIAAAEREKFKQELTSIISRNRSAPEAMKPNAPPLTVSNSLPTSALQTPIASTPKPGVAPSRQVVSRAASDSSDRRATPVITGSDPASDFRLRKKVLMSNPELGTLHRDLVMSGQITEAEFWDGREVRAVVYSKGYAEGR